MGIALECYLRVNAQCGDMVVIRKEKVSMFGFTPFAEQLNGRLAMIGFLVIFLLEMQSGQSIVHWLGLR
jgi:hypothetical protein